MNNIGEVLQAISIGLMVAYFLLNTNRVLKCIELCKECFAILRQRAGIREDELAKSLYKKVYLVISKVYHAINDNTNAIKYEENILQVYRETGEKLAEYNLSFNLAKMYFHQKKFANAKELWEKALQIGTEIGDRNIEAYCYLNLGAVYKSVGEYHKAREYT